MEKVLISVDELNAIITGAVQTALDAREKKEGESTLISREAAAKRLGVDVSTLWRWGRSNYLKMRKIGRSVWYLERDIRNLEMGRKEEV